MSESVSEAMSERGEERADTNLRSNEQFSKMESRLQIRTRHVRLVPLNAGWYEPPLSSADGKPFYGTSGEVSLKKPSAWMSDRWRKPATRDQLLLLLLLDGCDGLSALAAQKARSQCSVYSSAFSVQLPRIPCQASKAWLERQEQEYFEPDLEPHW
jgi:hypothetical protein